MSLVNELIKGLLPEDEKKRVVAVYGGGFKPPTKGHFEVVKQAIKENPDIDEFIINIGGKARDGVTPEEAIQIWDIYKQYLPISANINIQYSSTPPIKATYDYAKNHPNEEILFVIGAREGNDDDFKDISTRTKSLDKYPNLNLRTIVTQGGVSGTAARNAGKISSEKLRRFLPDELKDEEAEQVYQMISDKLAEGRKKKKDPKKGTGKKPKGSKRRLYTDEDPKDTVGIKFSTRQDIVDTLNKKSFKAKSHARQSQIINLIHQRLRAAYGRAKDPAVKKRLKTGLDYITKRKEASKKKTQRLKKQKLKENASYGQHIDILKHIDDLTRYMIYNGMNIQPLPTLEFIDSDTENAKDFFGKTAYYDPNNHKVVLYTLNRHPKDVMRSFAHEMIHHMQNYEGKLQSIHTQNTNEEGDLPEIEREAYEKGNMTFRSWTDTLTESILKEGRYDTISNQISRDIFNFWKENIDQGLVTFENSYEHEGEDIDIEATIKLSPEIEYLNVDGGADDETDFIVVNFKVNPDKLPGAWEEISFNLKDVIRHEIEHLTHGEGFMLKPGKYIENDQLIRQMIDMELLPKSSYFKLEKEIDANLQGMYFRAKKEKRPFIDVINTYLDAQDITPKEKQIVLNLWRSRRKALSLPKF